MTDNLFEGANAGDIPALDESKDYYQDLVGENKKFKDEKALARGKAEADQYIAVLTKRLDEMRNDYMKLNENYTAGAKLEELLDQLKKTNSQQTNNGNPPQMQSEVDKMPTIDPDKIGEIFSTEYKKQKLLEKQTDNFNTVKNKLEEEFGRNYKQVLDEHMANLGLEPEDMNALAKKSPQAFFRALGLDKQKEAFQSPARSSQRTDTFSPNNPKHTMSWYKKTYGNDPKIYYDKKITAQMNKDAMALGPEFFDDE